MTASETQSEMKRREPGRYWDRWIDALADELTRWRNRAGRKKTLLIRRASSLDIHERRWGKTRRVAQIDLGKLSSWDERSTIVERRTRRRGKKAVLRLDHEHTLRRTIALPAGTSDIVGPIIEHQLERLMPWPPAEMFHGIRISGDTPGDDALQVEVVAASKGVVNSAKADARAHGFDAIRVECAVDDDTGDAIPLNIPNYAQGRDSRRKVTGLLAGLTSIAVAISMTGFWSGFTTMSSLADLQRQTRQLNAQATAAASRIRDGGASASFTHLVTTRKETPSATLVLEILSRVIPDDTWIVRLKVAGAKLQLFGRSTNAAPLIGILEASPAFENVHFSAPTTRAQNRTERTFVLSADIRPQHLVASWNQ